MSLIRSKSFDYKDILELEHSSIDSSIISDDSDVSSSSNEYEYIPTDQTKKMHLLQVLSDRIKLVVNSAMNDLEKDMLQTSVRLNLSGVLGLYTKYYRAPTPPVKGYMPCQ